MSQNATKRIYRAGQAMSAPEGLTAVAGGPMRLSSLDPKLTFRPSTIAEIYDFFARWIVPLGGRSEQAFSVWLADRH